MDRDLRAQGCLDRDLISSVGLRSNGSDLTGRRGGGDLSPASYSTVACGGESPEYAVSGPPGVLSTRPWFGHGQRVTRDPPGAWVGLGKVHGGVCTGDSGSARRRSPERERSGRWIGLMALGSSTTGRRGATGAHTGFDAGRAAAQGHRRRG